MRRQTINRKAQGGKAGENEHLQKQRAREELVPENAPRCLAGDQEEVQRATPALAGEEIGAQRRREEMDEDELDVSSCEARPNSLDRLWALVDSIESVCRSSIKVR